MDFAHIGAPQGGRVVSALGPALEGLIVVVANPDRAGVVGGVSCKDHAPGVVVSARLARDIHAFDLGPPAGAALDRVLQNGGNHIGGGWLEHLSALRSSPESSITFPWASSTLVKATGSR